MDCPFCGGNQIFVTNSRLTKNGTQIWRRRKCEDCKEVFTTYEKINLSYVTVVKRSGKRQRYSRAKLFSGIYHSMLDQKNMTRGDIGAISDEITSEVEIGILGLRRRNINSLEIVDILFRILKDKYLPTYLRFLAFREEDNEKNIRKYLRKLLKDKA